MRNDEQQPPQESPSSQPYSSWSYNEDTLPSGAAAGNSAQPGYPPGNQQRQFQPEKYAQPDRFPSDLPDPNNPAAPLFSTPYYPDITVDMTNTLSYGQTMGFHPITIPQHSQPIPKLRRQERFQQSREENMRRQQRRISPDATSLGVRGLPTNRNAFPPGPTVEPPAGQRNPSSPGTLFSAPPFSPMPGSRVEQGPASTLQAGSYANPAVLVPPTPTQSAAEPAQDTGMLQRVKVQRATFLLTIAFVASSILGLLETVLFTYSLGSGTISDSYFQAYIIPNLIYNVVSGGALSSAFIPVFTSYETGRKDEKTAWHIASSALNLSVALMVVLAAVALIFAPALVRLYNPNVSPAELSLTTTLTRIMFFQAIVLGSGVIITAILNTKQDFTLTAIGTVLYNVGLIIGLIPGVIQTFHASANSQPTSLAIYSATFGVVLAAVLQVGVQIPGLFKVKMRYTFAFDWRHPGISQIARQMVPRVINAVMLSFSTGVDRFLLLFIATKAFSGLVTDYFLAFSILVLPVSLFASSASTAAFPTLANYVARGRLDRVSSIIMETLRGILFLAIPSCIGLIVLSLPIVQVLIEHGHFQLSAAQFTALALLFFALGLPGLAAVEILTRSFYALQDSRTPVTISVMQFILKIALSIILINMASIGVQWGMGGLALSTSVANTLEAVVLFLLLYQRIGGFDLRLLGSFLARMFLASAILAVVLLVLRTLLDHAIDTTSMKNLYTVDILKAIVKLLIELGVGSIVFLVMARLLHIEEINSGLVRRVLNILRIRWV